LDVHIGRVLLLIRAFSGGRRGRLEGLSKLARLDFLLRYPVYLERVLDGRGQSLSFALWPTGAERRAVESTMVRHKFGPFDARYYLLVGRLLGLELADQLPGSRHLSLRATDRGQEAADALVGVHWSVVDGRARALKRSLDLSGATLGALISAELPPAENRPWSVLSAP
jgi:hypothetical protein